MKSNSNVRFLRTVTSTIMLGGKRNIAWVALLAAAGALLEAAGVGSVMPFIAVATDPGIIERVETLGALERWTGLERDSFVFFLGAVFAVTTVIANVASIANTIALTRFSATIGYRLSTHLLRKLMARPYEYFLTANTAALSALVLASTRRVSDGIVSPFIIMLARSVAALAVLSILFWANPLVTLVVIGIVAPLYGVIFSVVRARLNYIGSEIVVQDQASHRALNEALAGIKDLQILGRTHDMSERFERAVQSLATVQTAGSVITQFPKYVIETAGVLTIVGVILWGLVNSNEPGVAVSLAALYAYAGYRLLPAAQAIFGSVSMIWYNADSIVAVARELNDGDVTARDPMTTSRTGPVTRFHSSVSLRDVTFTYPAADTPALRCVSLDISAGMHVGIVGPSGSGKSTILDVLVGLLVPERGGVYIDDRRLEPQQMAAWRSTIGYVPQSVFLADANVAENIAFGLPPAQIDHRRVRAAAEAAQLHEFIEQSLTDGYATVIGERGIRLSGGQRQRLGIARALYHDPQLLILDEATNALDAATESGFMSTIRSLTGSRTVVCVAHRLTTVSGCDKIFVVSEGSIAAVGTYDSLHKESSDFQTLIAAGSHKPA